MRLIKLISIATACLLIFGCTKNTPLVTEEHVDPDEFVGEWYVISNIPYFAERNKVGSKTTYLKTGANSYQDIFESRNGSFNNKIDKLVGSAKSLNEHNTQWQSIFYWVMRFKFEVLDVDDDYQIALLGHQSRKYGWVMARTKSISTQSYAQAMLVFNENGYDTTLFSKVPQYPTDIGKEGYQVVSN